MSRVLKIKGSCGSLDHLLDMTGIIETCPSVISQRPINTIDSTAGMSLTIPVGPEAQPKHKNNADNIIERTYSAQDIEHACTSSSRRIRRLCVFKSTRCSL